MTVSQAPRPFTDTLKVAFRALIVLALFGLNGLAIFGFSLRDPSRWVGLLMYLPLAPIGLLSLIVAALFRLPRSRNARWALVFLGLYSTVAGCHWMIGWSLPALTRPEDRRLRVLQWNVRWGGIAVEDETAWNEIGKEIIQRDPDLIVLSEAPFKTTLYQILDKMPGKHHGLSVLSLGKLRHFFHAFVVARWPVYLERWVQPATGGAAIVRIAHPERTIRVLIVDGASRVAYVREPMLRDLAMVCDRAAKSGSPIDLILGDFNAISRSLGFESLEASAAGYRLASRFCKGWRGSWPAFLPLLDIDHVLVHSGWPILGARFFTNLASDHRGQVVEVAMPDTS